MAGNRTLDHRIWGIAWPAILSNISIPLLGLVDAANIGLDFLFIVGLGLNSDGAAIATVIAEYLGCGLALLVVWRKLPARPAGEFFVRLKNLPAYRRLLRSSRHLFLRTVSLLFSFAFFTAMGEKLGSDTLAANSLFEPPRQMAAKRLAISPGCTSLNINPSRANTQSGGSWSLAQSGEK